MKEFPKKYFFRFILKNLPASHIKIISSAFALFTLILFVSGTFLIFPNLRAASTNKIAASKKTNYTIVIDAGHGGSDPGKVGVTGTLEKDINLKTALYLKAILEAQDMEVLMTRDQDKELSTDSKASDMKERIRFINKSNADIVVSIHQNSYTDPKVYGAQCFYYTNSEEGKHLAAILQKQIIKSTNQTKIREIKNNNDYYLLKHSALPIVIIECGFLSNPEEEELLSDEKYQREMAWGIHLGILEYLNSLP